MNCDGGAVRPEIDALRRILTVLDDWAFSYNEYFMEEDPAFTARMIGFDIVLKTMDYSY